MMMMMMNYCFVVICYLPEIAHSVILSGVHDTFYLLPSSMLRDAPLAKVWGISNYAYIFFKFSLHECFSLEKRFRTSVRDFFLSYLL